MNPISWLRMRACSVNCRWATCLPFRIYSPSVAGSSSPRIASNVDLPQPDGPAIHTYSPRFISRLMSASACVSTSSVKKTFRNRFNSMTACVAIEILRCHSIQPNAIVDIPLAHVRKDDAVSRLQTVLDLDGIDRTSAEMHRHTHGFASAREQFENLQLAFRATSHWPPHKQHILNTLERDGAIDIQIRPCSFRQRLIERYIHRDRFFPHRRVHARHMASHYTVARI